MTNAHLNEGKSDIQKGYSEPNVLDTKSDPSNIKSAQQRRRRWTKLSIIPFVILPAILAIIYYSLIAADRYAVEVKFAIRSPSSVVPSDLLGLVSGTTSSGSTTSDSYIVTDFLKSREFLDKIEKRIDLRAIYNRPEADFLAKFDPANTKEEFVRYLENMIYMYFDTSSQIITLEVQAFTPEDAKLIAEEVLFLSGNLINEISEQARLDTVRSAEAELNRAETRLKKHRRALSVFRESEQDINPTSTVEAQQLLLSNVLGELTAAKTKMISIRRFLAEDAPSVNVLRSRIVALETQLEAQKSQLGGGNATGKQGDFQTLNTRIGAYEVLAVDLEFLQQAYVTSLASLEAARIEADRQQRYLASFVHPSLPEEAIYPHRILNTFIVAVLSTIFWGISVMIFYIVREHAT